MGGPSSPPPTACRLRGGPSTKKAKIMEGPQQNKGTWHEKGRNHGRSPLKSGDLDRKGPKTVQVPIKNQAPGQKRAEIMEGPQQNKGTWHEKGRNHARSLIT